MPAVTRWIIAIAVSFSSLAWAADYHVGPGQTYANIGDVPWESLAAGDTVFIHARPTPYLEKWVLNRVGTAANPITVHGVPDANGALPIIHGEGATTRSHPVRHYVQPKLHPPVQQQHPGDAPCGTGILRLHRLDRGVQRH
jgi:hypothetical protein